MTRWHELRERAAKQMKREDRINVMYLIGTIIRSTFWTCEFRTLQLFSRKRKKNLLLQVLKRRCDIRGLSMFHVCTQQRSNAAYPLALSFNSPEFRKSLSRKLYTSLLRQVPMTYFITNLPSIPYSTRPESSLPWHALRRNHQPLENHELAFFNIKGSRGTTVESSFW